jgi:hypothetical protein
VGPSDFIGTGGFPLCFVLSDSKKSGKTMADKAKALAAGSGTDTESESEKKAGEIFDAIRLVINAGIVTLNGKPFNHAEFWESKTVIQEDIFYLFDQVLELSLKIFKKPVVVPRDQLEGYYFTAKTYGKSPIEVICHNGGYTDLDAYMFNMAVMAAGIERENDEAKRRAAEMERSRR